VLTPSNYGELKVVAVALLIGGPVAMADTPKAHLLSQALKPCIYIRGRQDFNPERALPTMVEDLEIQVQAMAMDIPAVVLHT
jgi:hypothetical protein